SQGAIDTQNVTITINGTNDNPISTPGSISGNEDDTTLTGQLIATDIDATDSLTFSAVSEPSDGSVSITSDGQFTFTPGDDFQDLAIGESRVVTFVYQVADNHGATDQNTITITINGSNDAPVISIIGTDSDSVALVETRSTLFASGTMTVFDADRSDIVTASVTGVSIGGTVAGLPSSAAEVIAMFSVTQTVVDSTSQSGSLQWFFDSQNEFFDYLLTDEAINLTYEITIQDSQGLTAIRHAHINITTNNLAPIAAGESYTILPNGRLTLTTPGPLVNDFDPDGDAIQFVLVSGPTRGTLTFTADGALVYKAGNQFASLDKIRYRVTDGRLYSEIVEIDIITLALPIQEPIAQTPSTTPSGPSTETSSQTLSQTEETLPGVSTAPNDATASNALIDGFNGPHNESTIVLAEQITKLNPNDRAEIDKRMIENVSWVFEQDFREIRDRSSNLREQSRLQVGEYLAAILPTGDNDASSLLTKLTLETAIIATANATLSAATAGTIFWALRGAALVATIATGMPALRNLDPANLLAEYRTRKSGDDEDDELETMIDQPKSKQ
ncbi:MAG TPA: hypothetical protein DDZ51_18505, partial [Planctomycetaceae bacterium]|nr:hypothetical protein [Planctomycetaceae bacterium]